MNHDFMSCLNLSTGYLIVYLFFFFSSRRRHTRWTGDWSSDVCSSDLRPPNQIVRRTLHRASPQPKPCHALPPAGHRSASSTLTVRALSCRPRTIDTAPADPHLALALSLPATPRRAASCARSSTPACSSTGDRRHDTAA